MVNRVKMRSPQIHKLNVKDSSNYLPLVLLISAPFYYNHSILELEGLRARSSGIVFAKGMAVMLITQTPLRISFLGGGTDYPEYFENHGGAVLGSAIDKAAFFSISRFYSEMFDYSIRIAYRKVECVSSIDEIDHAPFRECLRWCGIEKDIEINHSAELPAGTGLGSSGSFTVGLLNAIHAFQRQYISKLDLAYQAIDIERKVLNESVGVQDQTFAAVGGFNLIQFKKMGDFKVNPVSLSESRLEEFENHLMIFFTGTKRKAEELAKKQVQNITHNLHLLAQMRRMVDQAYDILCGTRQISAFGKLLDASWKLKRSLSESISNPDIDAIYQAGIESGALGGKLLGAGGGGFILFFIPPEKKAALEKRLCNYQPVPFRLNALGSHVVHNNSDHALPYNNKSLKEVA